MKQKILYGYQTVKNYIKSRYKSGEKLLITQKKYEQFKKENIELNSLILKNLQICTNEELNNICQNPHHNGIAIKVEELIKYFSLDQLGDKIIILDGVTDMGNLGAIIRSAAAFGYDMIIPTHNSAVINGAVCKNSAGGIEYIKIHNCNSLLQTIKNLKKANYFIIAASEKKSNISSIVTVKHMPQKLCIVMGSEDSGIRQSLINEMDYIYTIEGNPEFNVLNVSVASAVIMFDINRLLNDRRR